MNDKTVKKIPENITSDIIAPQASLHDKLVAVQQGLKVPKTLKNEFAHFNYRNAEGILEACKPLLLKHNATLTLDDTIELIGDRYYLVSKASFSYGNAQITVSGYAREEETKKGMDAAQITGSASSYARKYALSGLFAIDDGNDPDSRDNSAVNLQPIPKPVAHTYIAAWQVKMLLSKAKDFSGLDDKDAVAQWFKKKSGVEITKVKKADFARMQKLLEDERDV